MSNWGGAGLKLLTKHYEGDKTKDDAVGGTCGSGGGGWWLRGIITRVWGERDDLKDLDRHIWQDNVVTVLMK